MKIQPGKFDYLFVFLVFFDLWAMHLYPGLRLISKPLIVSALLIFYIMKAGDNQKPVVLTALIFALLGDIFLLFGDALFFQFGLGAFLIMQLCYASYFRTLGLQKSNFRTGIIVLVVTAAILFNIIFRESFGPMQWPVMIYTLAIAAMVVSATMQPLNVVMYGALLFLLSDMALAFNKFVQPFAGEGILVMLTYAAAQYLIITGIVKAGK